MTFFNNKKTEKSLPDGQPILDLSNINAEFKDLSCQDQYLYLRRLTWIKKIYWLTKISKTQRKAIIDYRNKFKEKKNNLKKDFNKNNVFEIRGLNLWYDNGEKQSLYDINLDIRKNKVTALIGPSGCGKSTFLRNLNRMHDLNSKVVIEGDIWFNGKNIYAKKMSLMDLRTKIGMVFQKPTPFNMSIYDNVAFGPKNHGIKDQSRLDEIVKKALEDAALWNEVKNDLHASATSLSGGQQQRLCIARSIALEPDVLLMDEPTSALDPIATSKIEKLIKNLSEKVTIIIVTHSMAQAQRISDDTAFFLNGKIIEANTTRKIFTKPKTTELRHYLNGDYIND